MPDGPVWGAVCGLKREADCLPDGIPTRVAGGSRERAAQAALDLADGGAGGIVSFGFCGGLDPQLSAGDLVVADGVVTADGVRRPADADLTLYLRDRLGGRGGWMLGIDKVIASPTEKRVLFDRTRAVAVDMESHGVALAAPIPFVVLRVVRRCRRPGRSRARRSPASVRTVASASGPCWPPWRAGLGNWAT